MNAYFRLMRLDKPVGIYLLLWPTLWALFLAADGWPELGLLIIFVLGVVLMRSAGCVINDYADRKIDQFVERTQHRPITSGEISPKNALLLFFGLIVLAFALVLLTNLLTVQLAFIAAFLATFIISAPTCARGMPFCPPKLWIVKSGTTTVSLNH